MPKAKGQTKGQIVRVFKYRGGSREIMRRDLKTLAKNQIFSAPIETLNDPFETRVRIRGEDFKIGRALRIFPSFKYTNKIKEVELRFIETVKKFEIETKQWGIYSLSKSYKDELLWAYYADSHRGFCIEYELSLLLAYKLQREITIEVDYVDQIPFLTIQDMSSINDGNRILIKKLIGTKSIRWKHESEIRIVTARTGLYEFDFRAVKAVHFGHRVDERLKKLVMRVLRGRGIKYYSVEPIDGSYRLDRFEIVDIYDNAKRYRERVAPIEEDVPIIDDKIRPFENLIRKAIEVVRREPYCEKVIGAYVSGSKGTPDDPVFYVSYERSDGLPQNFFISKSDLESSG